MRYSVCSLFVLASSVAAAPLQSSTWEELSIPYELPPDSAGKPIPVSPSPQNPWTPRKEPSTIDTPKAGSAWISNVPAMEPESSTQGRPGVGSARGQQPVVPGQPPARQREDAIRYNLRRVNQALTALDDSLQRKPRYWRSQQELDEYFHRVWDLGNIVVNELHNGADDIRYNAASLTDAEALGLQRQVSVLDTQLSNVVGLIIGSKRDVDEIYRRREVLDLLTRAEVDMGNFIDAIIGRLSGLSQTIGRGIRSRFVSNLERAVRDYRR